MNDLEGVRAWLRKCPLIADTRRFNVNYLSDEPGEYSLYSVPTSIAYTENVLGEEVPKPMQTLNLVLASKETFGSDSLHNNACLTLWQSITSWIMEQNAKRKLPEIESGTVRSIVPTLSVYPLELEPGTARYQIQLKLSYKIKEG